MKRRGMEVNYGNMSMQQLQPHSPQLGPPQSMGHPQGPPGQQNARILAINPAMNYGKSMIDDSAALSKLRHRGNYWHKVKRKPRPLWISAHKVPGAMSPCFYGVTELYTWEHKWRVQILSPIHFL